MLGRGDPVHVRHVDVHEDDIGCQSAGDLDRFGSGRRRADHLDVALETEKLGQVVACLGDVVNDEDSDPVGHDARCKLGWMSVGPLLPAAGRRLRDAFRRRDYLPRKEFGGRTPHLSMSSLRMTPVVFSNAGMAGLAPGIGLPAASTAM